MFQQIAEFKMQFMYPLGQMFFTRPRPNTGAHTEGNRFVLAIFVSATSDMRELIM